MTPEVISTRNAALTKGTHAALKRIYMRRGKLWTELEDLVLREHEPYPSHIIATLQRLQRAERRLLQLLVNIRNAWCAGRVYPNPTLTQCESTK